MHKKKVGKKEESSEDFDMVQIVQDLSISITPVYKVVAESAADVKN